MKPIRFFLLGPFKVSLDGYELTGALRTRKESAILAYLAEESTRAHPRETVAELLWPDRPEKFARMNLRQALLGIRKAFGNEEITNGFLQVTESVIQINRGEIWLDTAVFEAHLRTSASHIHENLATCLDCIEDLERAVQYYRGNFLEDLILGDVSGFHEWLLLQREHYTHGMLTALQSLARAYFKRADYELAFHNVRRFIELAPLEESAHRMMMRILYLTGRRNAALEQYHACREIIQRELGIEPSIATRQLYDYIREEFPIDKIDTGNLSPLPKSRQSAPPAVLPHAGLYDPNTQIPLRALFMDRLQHAITRMERCQLGIAVCVIAVNYRADQNFGSEVKKKAEQYLISRLAHSVRKGDTIGRLQDDVYALILEEIKDVGVIPQIVQKVSTAISAPIRLRGANVEVRVVSEISIYPQDGADPVSLLGQAEEAVRAARNRLHFPSPASSL